jgi:hypothetical protein
VDLLRNSTAPVLVLQDLPEGELSSMEDVNDAPALRASFPPEAM